MRTAVATLTIALSTAGLRAEPPSLAAGQVREISLTRDSETAGPNGSSGSTHDRDTIIERVLAVRPDGVELRYELPADISDAERASGWYFPLRVLRATNGTAQLLNRAELEHRVDAWLKGAKLLRSACGQWVFTWNAFRISCDPEDALKTAAAFDVGSPDLRDGASYGDGDAEGTALLVRKDAADGATFTTELRLDPEHVKRERAESDVVVAKLTGKPIELEAAQRERAKDVVSGTISVTFNVDRKGEVRRRTKVIRMETKRPTGVERETITQVLERRLRSPSP